MSRTVLAAALAASSLALAPHAQAQSVLTASAGVQADTDIRSRGLSDSDGKLGVTLDGTLPITSHIEVTGSAETLRSSHRNGGSDLGVQIAPQYITSSGGWDFTAGVRGHVYVDAGELDYVEMEGAVSRTLGPAWLTLGASYAPSQDAIGGDNLYLSANAGVGIPGSPISLYAGIGQTLGSTDNAVRAVRLRPDGDYTDWYLAVERSRLNFTIGMEYTGTSIDQSANKGTRYWDKHTGDKIAAYMRVAF